MNYEVQRLFEAALDLPESGRAEFIEGQTTDPAIRREVLSLLVHDAVAEPFFAGAVQSEASSLQSSLDLPPGMAIGPYRVVSILGRGGMGAVYLAERADGAFEQRAAIKLIQSPSPAAFLLDRFQQERRILAHLSHPYIAGLFDGGQTAGGFPYFVMEYVAGLSIDVYCDRSQLSVSARLELFRKVCDAVEYAHQNLIVHRDLKPANILVTAAGQPKLLDFGIAKVLDPTQTDASQPSTRLLTPEYASPEQIRGESITTATDVYSLGGVLYKLITGRPPNAVDSLSPLEAAQAIAEQETPRASSLRPGLPADLDAILHRALRKDAARRYRTVAEFSNDLRRYMEGRPVLAAPDSLGYRTRKFVRRNWIAMTAALAVALALTAGTGVALWQARRAERRFADVRQLANTFLFDFENSIHTVAGATRARQLVVATGTTYLDRLSADAGSDRNLIRELAESYLKLGDIEGSTTEANVGNQNAALTSYRKSLALRDSIGDANASDSKIRVGYIDSMIKLILIEEQAGDLPRSVELTMRAVALCESWKAASSTDAGLVVGAARAYTRLARLHDNKGDFTAAMAASRRSLALYERALELLPGNVRRLRAVAIGHWDITACALHGGNFVEAVDHCRQAVKLLEQVCSAEPHDVSLRRDLMVAIRLLGEATQKLRRQQKGNVADAVPIYERAYGMANQLIAEDPNNALVRNDLPALYMGYGWALQQAGRPKDALGVLLRGAALEPRALAQIPNEAAFMIALNHMTIAECRKELRDPAGALRDYGMAVERLDRLLAARPANFRYLRQKALSLQGIGGLLAARGDLVAARASYRAGLDIAEKLPATQGPLNPADLIADLRSADQRAMDRMGHRMTKKDPEAR